MARIQTPQHVQELQAEFKVRGPFGLELLETIQPTYQLGRQKVASLGYPKRCFGVVSAGAGGVGTNIEVSLTCPANRGIVIVLDRWSYAGPALVTQVHTRITDGVAQATVSSTVTTKAFQDGRLATAIPDGILRVANPLTAAPNGQLVGIYSVLSDDTIEIEANIILGGGAYFLVRDVSVNSGVDVNFHWTEFLLEDR